MKLLDQSQMLAATRLTRSGRLMEAVAVLRRVLGSAGSADAPAGPSPTAPALQIIDAKIAAGGMPGADADAVSNRSILSAPQALDWQTKLPGLPRRRAVEPEALAPSVGRTISGSFSNAAGSRSYKLYIPSSGDKRPSPLIVMLHGCAQSADDFAAGTRMSFAAEKRGCFVVYPEQPRAANASNCWNWFRSSDQRRDQGEPSLIAGLTRQIMKDHNIDPRRVYVAGLSAGGAAAAVLGETYPDLYAAVGVHSGLACGSAHDLTSAFNAMRGDAGASSAASRGAGARVTPTIVFHGDRDSTVHPRNGAHVISRAGADAKLQTKAERKSTASGNRYSHTVKHDARGSSILELWELHGAGHAWSGGSPMGSFTDQSGPDATEEMLRFFLEHRRST